MHRALRSVPLLACLILLNRPPAAHADSRPGSHKLAVDFEASALVVHGAEPSGQVAWFGVQRYLDPDFSVTRLTRGGTVQAAADGVARIELDRPLADRAIWVVVDLKSGDFLALTPSGYPLRKPAKGQRGEGRGDGDKPDELLDDRPEIAGLMVRPQIGAWQFAAADGGGDDQDGKNDGRMRLALPRFMPLQGSPAAPAKLDGKDLWFVIDPVAMNLAVLQGGIEQ
jgi:hypothetical protein